MPGRVAGHGEHFAINEFAAIFGGVVEIEVVLLSKPSDCFGTHGLLLQDRLPLSLQTPLPVENHGESRA